MNRVPVHVQTSIKRLAELEGTHLAPRFEATLDGVHRVAVSLGQGLSGGNASRHGRHPRRENTILILKIVDLELVLRFHEPDVKPISY
jgi:hypothetical protein